MKHSSKKILTFNILLILNVLSILNSKAQCTGDDIINLKKTALIFGEKDYKYSKALTNPVNDAICISDSLKKLGFDVQVYYDENYQDMSNHINAWYKKLPKYDVALFYFSGHGIEVNGENYLLPVDANPKSPSELPYIACSANDILSNMESNNSKYNIMILDACRNNPLLKSWTKNIKDGLANMNGNGSFIGFASAPGTTASDGNNKNGTYTEAILKYMMIPDISITQIFTKVNYDVRTKTFGVQIPFMSSSLSLDFCFNVTNKTLSLSTAKVSTFQPASKITLSADGEKIFVINDSQIKLKDARSLNGINSPLYKDIKSLKLATSGSEKIYTIDENSQSVLGFDYKKNLKTFDLKIQRKPTSFMLSNEERKLYVLTDDSTNNSEILVIDITQKKSTKKIIFNNSIKNIFIGPSDNYTYAISSCSSQRKGMYIVDNRTNNAPIFYEGVACGNAIGISPGNGKIFVSNVDADGIHQINILDGRSQKVIKTIDFNAFSFNFTLDNKYILALGETEILIIDSKNDEILNKISFDTKPDGIALADDGRAFISLPLESRIAILSISKESQKDSVMSPESMLKNFQEQVRKKKIVDPQFRINEILSTFNQEFSNAIYTLGYELGLSYEHHAPDNTTPNFKEGFLSYRWGIRSKDNPSKIIFPLIKLKVNANSFVLTMKEESGGEEVYRSVNRTTDWEKVKTFIRNFYVTRLKRIEP